VLRIELTESVERHRAADRSSVAAVFESVLRAVDHELTVFEEAVR
jgi:hypothetical protein